MRPNSNKKSFIILILLFILFLSYFSKSYAIQIVAEDALTKKWHEIALYNKTYAVVIGIDEYPNLSAQQQLSYAVSDAKAVARILDNKFVFDKVFTLYNDKATKSNIEDLLLNKLSKVDKDDAVFVFFAGHGGQEKTDYGSIGFIVPSDGSFNDMRKVISMTAIRDDISKRISAKHVFFVMDACYSGILVSKRGEEENTTSREINYLRQIAKESVRQVLTAGSANEQVLDGGPDGHSVFTGRLLEILNDANDFITASEISAAVKERVYADAQARGHQQTPKSGSFFGLGDFIFMPSSDKKLGNIQQQIGELENELTKISDMEKRAQEFKDDAAQREARRQRQVAEAKLTAKKLEQQRLETEKIEKEKRFLKQKQQASAMKAEQAKEEERLARLQQEISQKRKTYKTSMVLSLDQAIKEQQELENQILGIKNKYIEELKARVMGIAKNHSENLSNQSLVKDEFETQAEFQARVSKLKSPNTTKEKFGAAVETVESSYNEQVSPLITQMEQIADKGFTIYGHDALTIKLGRYNAENETFKITIASKNIKKPIYSQTRLEKISEVEGQARRIGLQKGDYILKYNNIDVTPNSNWDKLKQTVISESTTIVIDRNGTQKEFALRKGKIGIHHSSADYYQEIEPNMFIVNGDLPVPRTEARKFKQNYSNGFVTAELKVKAVSSKTSLVFEAMVVDESNDKRYDLFKSRFANLGHSLLRDNELGGIYLTKSYSKYLIWEGAHQFATKLNYKGIQGWQLPSLDNYFNLWGTQAFALFNFNSKQYQTNTKSKGNDDYYRYQSWDNRISYGGNTGIVVCVVAFNHLKKEYSLYKDRFVELLTNMIFDTENNMIWLSKPLSEKYYTWLEADKYIKGFTYSSLKGWRLPELFEFKSLYDLSKPGLPSVFNFNSKRYQTNTKSKGNDDYYRYQSWDNRISYGGNTGLVLPCM